MNYFSDENYHKHVLGYGESKYQGENSVGLFEIHETWSFRWKIGIDWKSEFPSFPPPPFTTAYGRDIRTGGTPKGWLWYGFVCRIAYCSQGMVRSIPSGLRNSWCCCSKKNGIFNIQIFSKLRDWQFLQKQGNSIPISILNSLKNDHLWNFNWYFLWTCFINFVSIYHVLLCYFKFCCRKKFICKWLV